ncbi:GGDEF domain-containing protein [Saccharospirillum impatiens]|uniref:GGDEF domain-containing protein n=1 Tax=Saccharospirillum impatiens TaxID=169438 RepID=UPI0004277236|nr:GGDEF domain-containing protein [Saccharospirillum impatiens]
MLKNPKTSLRASHTLPAALSSSGVSTGSLAAKRRRAGYDYAKHAEKLLKTSAILDLISDAVLVTDTDGTVTYMNSAAESLTGTKRQDAIGRPLEETFQVIDTITRNVRENIALHVMATGHAVAMHNSSLLITPDRTEMAIEDSATPLFSDDHKIAGVMIVFHDARYSKEVTAKMTYMAQHDPLTGLFNRYAFNERFEESAALARRHRKKMVLLFIDLDNFKELNDTQGHGNGDHVLKTMGQEILRCVRVTDHVCRFGGDEFVVLLSDIEQPEQAFAVVDKVRAAADALMTLNNQAVSLKLSIGVSIYPDNGDALETLLQHADADMYRVKSSKARSAKKPAADAATWPKNTH